MGASKAAGRGDGGNRAANAARLLVAATFAHDKNNAPE